MDDISFAAWTFLIPIVFFIGAFATAIIAMLLRSRVRELEIRERIAMIEKGLVPPPEVDPRGFDTAMDRYDRIRLLRAANRRAPRRHRSAAVTLMRVCLGLLLLIAFAGESPQISIGGCGLLVVIGCPFLRNRAFNLPHKPN